MIAPPHGIDQIVALYGDITIEEGEIVAPRRWESDNMTSHSFNGLPHGLYLNRIIVEPLTEALRLCAELPNQYFIRTIGCFCPRFKSGGKSSLSLHSWGVALDINASTNPRRRKLTTDMPPEWVECWERVGWTWGGRWKHMPDAMHMQWASGY